MKKIVLKLVVLGSVGVLTLNSCSKTPSAPEKSTQETTVVENNSEVTETEVAANDVISSNVGKTALEVKLFEDVNFSERLKKIAGADYETMVKNFNVQTPIVEENGIYKLTGCKAHDCPAYQTTVLYDKKNDNFNIIIDQNGKVKELEEKGKIEYTESLKSK